MQKLENLDSSVFQMLDDAESLTLIGGNDEVTEPIDGDGCRRTGSATLTADGVGDYQRDWKCVFF
jgi:hypothetical protein